MAGDIDRNIFFVPLEQRKEAIEADSLGAVGVGDALAAQPAEDRDHERTPVAFVEINSHIELIDAHGVIMDLPAGQQAQLFVSGDRRHDRHRAAFHSRRAHEDL